MESIKLFLLDESGSSEAASSVILIAAVGAFMLALVTIYWTAVSAFFTRIAGHIGGFDWTTAS